MSTNQLVIKYYVIIVAGGVGSRMNSLIPKQFMKLQGKPVLMHTIEKFYTCGLNPQIILVLPDSQVDYWKSLCVEYHFNTPIEIAHGGETRYHSVKNGLEKITGDGVVAIHDAVRPLVNNKTILASFKAAEMYGNAVPAIPLHDSIRKIESGKNLAVDRSKYCVIQTPQCFNVNLLKKAYSKDYRNTFTDDASVVEAIGEQIHLIDGTADNIKITTPTDLIIAEALLNAEETKVVK